MEHVLNGRSKEQGISSHVLWGRYRACSSGENVKLESFEWLEMHLKLSCFCESSLYGIHMFVKTIEGPLGKKYIMD